MMKYPGKWFVFLTLALSVILSCRLYDDRVELSKDGEWRFYSINSETIINALAQGNTDVFTLLSATPEVASVIPAASIHWTQADYFRVAQALHEQSWGEPLGDQNLYNMAFDMACSEIDQGTFSTVDFKAYKVIGSGDDEVRFERWIKITPLENSVLTLNMEYQPNVHNKRPFDMSLYQITAEEGLQIAERNGGDKVRLGVNNQCKISATAPGSDGKGWLITYANFPTVMDILFKIAIDPKTGEYKVIYP